MTLSLASHLRCDAWRELLGEALSSPAFTALEAHLATERRAGHRILPAEADVFAALDATPPQSVRVVILGQDPYPTPGHAHGLAFSYRGAGSLPRSLRNIVSEVERDVGCELGEVSGDLSAWATQGVLLLNTILTVRAGEAGSHRRVGWEAFTDAVLASLVDQQHPIVFVLWGRVARRHAQRISAPHAVLEAGHPSPLSVRYFAGCGHFSAVNEIVRGAPIDWAAIGGRA